MARPEAAWVRLALRQVRNGVLYLLLAAFVMLEAVVTSFTAASLGTGGLQGLAENPALRALYGEPFDPCRRRAGSPRGGSGRSSP